MNETFTESVDLVVAGTGVAALSAAITAADAGLSVLMLESTDRWGGSSAMSGGGLWLPNNPLMRRAQAADSRDEALAYREQTVGDAGPATSRERKEAFLDGVDGFVGLAERHGVRFARSADYPDYYPELPGGKIGRAIEVEPFDGEPAVRHVLLGRSGLRPLREGPVQDVQPAVSASALADAAKYPVDLFNPWRFDGTNLYGIPENIQSMSLFYNKKH
jgi:glycine/D-amino acid oxidase-like deaminating enzyme